MDNNLSEGLKTLKIGYLKKLEEMLPSFKLIDKEITPLYVDELYKKVHTISGTSGMYGLNKLSHISTGFEVYLKDIKCGIKSINEIELKEKLFQYIKTIEKVIDVGV